MTRLEARARVFAYLLSALAGFVDAIGFVRSGGFFVSFMSGNSTRLGVGLADSLADAVVAAAIIICFIAGVVGGAVLGDRVQERRPAAVLLGIAILLSAAAFLDASVSTGWALALLAIAMGSENAVFERGGEVRIGVTYMTGSLVRVGNGIAGAILGRESNGWRGYLLLWIGFVIGAIAGAASYRAFSSGSLWVASFVALCLSLASLKLFAGTAKLREVAS